MNLGALAINRKSRVPLHRQLEAGLRAAILSGSLRPGDRILSSRELQKHLGLSRNTVLDALAQLHAEGYLATRRGAGTFVAAGAQAAASKRTMQRTPRRFTPSPAAERFISAEPYASNVDWSVPYRPGLPALDAFPWPAFRRALAASSSESLDYPPAFGDPHLRTAIAQRLAQTRGVACTPDQILITTGAQASFALIAAVMLRAGDRVVVEEPGYPNLRAVLEAHGTETLRAPVDDTGIDVAHFRSQRAAFAYVTPSHQYPTGVVLSLERRFELLAWATRCNAWIVEDDYDSEFNYRERPHPALQGLDEAQRVIYAGTFSKVLAPGLRVAYLVLPPELCDAFAAAHQVLGGAPSGLVQSALARFMQDGHLGRHIARMRRIYDERRRFASDGFARLFGSESVRDTGAGLHFIVELPARLRDVEFSRRAGARGVLVPPLSGYYYGRPRLNGVVVGYAGATVAASRRALRSLATLV